ncbi:MAG: putative toxin-antitoxin system toxin component, PIN family [Phaeodactylibacter sp.]|nr:putative toxin-antitoxin system toxin component, PIN family [Phaeodactylibacter sp.]MCB9304916.1 putative toxin-antitoxin system toxin component, PIN family [Lewinellaceae bacterium]
MDRVVIDTNSLLVSIGRKSKYRPIFDALLSGRFRLLISNDILSEYAEIIEQKANALVAGNIVDFLVRSPDVERVDIYFKWAILHLDGDDNKFADCAFNGRADFIVTDDRHFRILSEVDFPHIKVISTKQFLERLTTQ